MPKAKEDTPSIPDKTNGRVNAEHKGNGRQPDYKKLFEVFGLDLTAEGDEARGRVSLLRTPEVLGQSDHRAVSVSQPQLVWAEGNAYTFVNHKYDERLAATEDKDYWPLRDKRELPLQTLRRHGVAWDPFLECYLLPFKAKNGDGKPTVRNLQRYWLRRADKLMLPILPLPLYGLDQLSDDKSLIAILVEGPWDAIALDQHLRSCKTRSRYDILAVPAAGVFKPDWFQHLAERTVRLTFDNDKAGRDGQQRIIKLAREAKADVKLLSLKWPAGYKPKCDLDDLVRSGAKVMEFLDENCERADVSERRVIFVRGDQISEEKVDWMDEGRIAFGTFVSLAGLMGTHKSDIARHLAAKATAGLPMLNSKTTTLAAFNVMYLTSEDAGSRVRDLVKLDNGELIRTTSPVIS